jgi:hypothetical protein
MVKSESGRDLDEEAAAQQAADVAAELSEATEPQDRWRVAKALGGVTRSAGRAASWGTGVARRQSHQTNQSHQTDQTLQTGQIEPTAQTASTPARRVNSVTTVATVARRGTRLARQGAGTAGRSFAFMVNWLTGQVLAMAPKLRIRDQETLRAQFPGRDDDAIAELLIERAARAAATVGGATGVWSVLPTLPAFPAEIAAEALAVTGIEIKLVAELHEAYGMPATGTATERARAYIASWAHRRGVYMVPGGLLLVAGSPLAGQVRRRLAARVRRSTFSLAPLFTGAVAGAMINRRETRRLGNQVRDDLRNTRDTLPQRPVRRLGIGLPDEPA